MYFPCNRQLAGVLQSRARTRTMSSSFTPLEQAMDQMVRQRRSESAWREIVARQEQSGLTVAEFCEREGMKAASLYGWRVRLRPQDAGKRTSPAISKSARAEKTSAEC